MRMGRPESGKEGSIAAAELRSSGIVIQILLKFELAQVSSGICVFHNPGIPSMA